MFVPWKSIIVKLMVWTGAGMVVFVALPIVIYFLYSLRLLFSYHGR